MTGYAMGLAAMSGFAVALGVAAVGQRQFVFLLWGAATQCWQDRSRALHMPVFRWVPWFQMLMFLLLPVTFLLTGWMGGLACLGLCAIPSMAAARVRERNREKLRVQLDTMLVGLSNALRTTGNLVHALQDVADGEPEPMCRELHRTLFEVRLGYTVEVALSRFAGRTELPELQAVVTQLTVGKRTGGDLAGILGVTAESLREMRRLEGVVQTRTAEGRSQALVMGLVPPFLAVGLHFLNPLWLAPMWSEPIGWVLLGVCAVLEVSAILIIRRIVAVDI